MNTILNRCLDDLEARLDPADEDRLLDEWTAFSEGRCPDEIFSPRRARRSAPGIEWPAVRVNTALENPEAMLLQQYGACSHELAAGSGSMLNVRANYGTSILPLLLGVKPFVMPDEMDTLPTSEPLNDVDAIRRVVDAGMPDLFSGYGARVMEIGQRFAEIGKAYPRIGRCVHPYHPDLQGPLDVCEVVWGSSIFIALYDDPGLVHHLLRLVTKVYIAFMQSWAQIVPFEPAGNCHWGYFHRGSIMIRLDSAMNISLPMYEEFARPYDQQLLDTFGGGAIHFCGRGDHFIASLTGLRGLTAINLTQPHLNDMEHIYVHTIDQGINLLGLERTAAETARIHGRQLHGRVHCT